MDYYINKKECDFLRGELVLGTNKVPFFYREETPRSYAVFNGFIQGMEFLKATASISTATKLAVSPGDKIRLDSGVTLKVVNMQPTVNKRRAMYGKSETRYIINLE